MVQNILQGSISYIDRVQLLRTSFTKLGQIVHAPHCTQLLRVFTESGEKPRKEINVWATSNPLSHENLSHDYATLYLSLRSIALRQRDDANSNVR